MEHLLPRGRRMDRCPDEHCRSKSPSGQPGKSVEEMCTCGKHTCPAPLQDPISFEGESSYNTDYKKWELPTFPKPVPEEPLKSLPFESDSSYHQDYRKWDLPEKVVRPKEQFLEPQENRDFATSYRSNYKQWELPKVQKPPPQPEVVMSPYDSINSVYRENYQHWDLPKKIVSPSETYLPVKEDRNFETVYRNSYQGTKHSICPVSLLPPIPNPPPGRHTMFWDSVAKTWY
ncbi:STOP repeat-containing protein [Cryptosporidium felis]|nr:STOP repeat-containing protein [Cryptosporidium felis]